ncbi:MAG: 50S ribosomal protein L34 [Planctomycetes bacterium]|nr:50S ribosomal protein L34 [Planctomycetota bacterium]MBI3846884.1 50S ribosomal protein L34 [Planctomycetota bacterium]
MKVNIRRSNLKKRRKVSFLRRMRTKGGRAILKQRRHKHKLKPGRRDVRKRRKQSV